MMPHAAIRAETPSLSHAKEERSLRLEIEQLKHIIKLLGAEVKSAREGAEELLGEKKELEQRLHQKESSSSQEHQRMRQIIRTLEEENTILLSQKELLETQQKSYASQLTDQAHLKQQIERLQKERQEAPPIAERTKRNQEPSETPSPQLARLAMELSKTQEEVHGLTCERAALIRAHKEAEQEMTRLQEEVQTLHTRVVQYEQEEGDYKKSEQLHRSETESLHETIAALQALLEEKKELVRSLSTEKETTSALLATETEEKTTLQCRLLVLDQTMKEKNDALESMKGRMQMLETQIANQQEENQESDKRLKETEELLIVKIAQLDTLEEEMEQLKETLSTTEETKRMAEQEKASLEENLHEEQKRLSLVKEQNDTLSKELETARHKGALAAKRLSHLENWKRRADQSLHQMRAALDGFSEYEKHLEHENTVNQRQMTFADEIPFFNTTTLEHGSLF